MVGQKRKHVDIKINEKNQESFLDSRFTTTIALDSPLELSFLNSRSRFTTLSRKP